MAIRPGPCPAGAQAAAARLLRELAALEERRAEGEEGHAHEPTLRRLEAKLDLVLDLLAQLLPDLATLPVTGARISARGIQFDEAQPAPSPAVLVWQPSEAIPMTLRLPVRADDAEGRAWAFDGLEPELEELLGRHVFRLHRRWLAAQRQR